MEDISSPAEIPKFPRLADRIRARQYLSGGTLQVVLHGLGAQETIILPRETWAVLRCADGTRTIEGILLAARREGIRAAGASLVALLATLAERGLLESGPPAYDLRVRPGQRKTSPSTPIAQIPDFTWSCDGRGACCSTFATVVMTPEDVCRARSVWPEFRVSGLELPDVFLPLVGSAPHPLSVGTVVDGNCGFLETDRRCGLHARGGVGAKPRGCRAYPRRLVDNGREVRATLLTECACVLRRPAADGGGVLEPGIVCVADLSPLDSVDELPCDIPWTKNESVPRAHLLDWLARCWDEPWPADVGSWLWCLAQELRREEQSWMSARILVLYERLSVLIQRESQWRGASDPNLVAMRWMASSLLVLSIDELGTASSAAEDAWAEHRYLQAAWWGYVDVGKTPWETWLRGRALRILLGRVMRHQRPAEASAPMFDEPLAVVDAIFRSRAVDPGA